MHFVCKKEYSRTHISGYLNPALLMVHSSIDNLHGYGVPFMPSWYSILKGGGGGAFATHKSVGVIASQVPHAFYAMVMVIAGCTMNMA